MRPCPPQRPRRRSREPPRAAPRSAPAAAHPLIACACSMPRGGLRDGAMLRALHLSLPSLLVAAGLTALAGCRTQHNIGKQPHGQAAAPAPPRRAGSPRAAPRRACRSPCSTSTPPATPRPRPEDPLVGPAGQGQAPGRRAADLRRARRHLPPVRAAHHPGALGRPRRRRVRATRPVFDNDAGRVFLDTLRGAASASTQREPQLPADHAPGRADLRAQRRRADVVLLRQQRRPRHPRLQARARVRQRPSTTSAC